MIENSPGPCAKQVVTATLITKSGQRFVGQNDCLNPQSKCPRVELNYPHGEGYELCIEICKQTAHAEINAIAKAGEQAINSTIYLEGHTVACIACAKATKLAGIKIIFQPPPTE